jgi:hypothetical protein
MKILIFLLIVSTAIIKADDSNTTTISDWENCIYENKCAYPFSCDKSDKDCL